MLNIFLLHDFVIMIPKGKEGPKITLCGNKPVVLWVLLCLAFGWMDVFSSIYIL